MAQIGAPKREIYVEPLALPVPQRDAKPVQTPEQTPQPVGVPV